MSTTLIRFASPRTLLGAATALFALFGVLLWRRRISSRENVALA